MGPHRGRAEIADLFPANGVVEDPYRLLDGGLVVPAVGLVEVDRLHPQAIEAVRELLLDGLPREPARVRVLVHPPVDRGGDDLRVPVVVRQSSLPKDMQPRRMRETVMPVEPSVVYSMRGPLVQDPQKGMPPARGISNTRLPYFEPNGRSSFACDPPLVGAAAEAVGLDVVPAVLDARGRAVGDADGPIGVDAAEPRSSRPGYEPPGRRAGTRRIRPEPLLGVDVVDERPDALDLDLDRVAGR